MNSVMRWGFRAIALSRRYHVLFAEPCAREFAQRARRKTIRLLYAQKADVTNQAAGTIAQTRQAYALLNQAAPLITQAPDQAMTLLIQAERLDPGNVEIKKMQAAAMFNQGVFALKEGVAAGRANDRSRAQARFRQAQSIYERLSQSPYAPPGTRENLNAARQNLLLVESP